MLALDSTMAWLGCRPSCAAVRANVSPSSDLLGLVPCLQQRQVSCTDDIPVLLLALCCSVCVHTARFKLATLVQYVPLPVVGGYLGYVGKWLLVELHDGSG